MVAQKVHETGVPQAAAEHAATARDTVAGTAASARDRAAEHAAAAREVAAAKYSDLTAEVSHSEVSRQVELEGEVSEQSRAM